MDIARAIANGALQAITEKERLGAGAEIDDRPPPREPGNRAERRAAKAMKRNGRKVRA